MFSRSFVCLFVFPRLGQIGVKNTGFSIPGLSVIMFLPETYLKMWEAEVCLKKCRQ